MVATSVTPGKFLFASELSALISEGRLVVSLDGHRIALFSHEGRVFAVDNRCPHMGFPLDRGSVHDCILTCHWHHARFDLASGGTFDPWADDLRAFPVEIRGTEIWVDVSPRQNVRAHHVSRLRVGLERDLSLVIAKSSIALVDGVLDAVEPFRAGLEHGTTYRQNGWGQGLTMHACMMNLLPLLDQEDRPRALYHGLSAVARDCAGMAPRFILEPLPDSEADPATLKRWFRRFIEVRDVEGAERCIVSAIQAGADDRVMADMLFAAATDHRYIQIGHPLDFTNKALEALDVAGWDHAIPTLSSLVRGYAEADRMEESNSWRHPVDIVAILDQAFESLPNAVRSAQATGGAAPEARDLVPVLLADSPQAIVDTLLGALNRGCGIAELAGIVAYATALRVARFHTSNEFGDWDTALHTFTFANAVHQGLRRSPSAELLRGVFDAAMSIYLDRFLNVPAARIPEPTGTGNPGEILEELPALLDRQQQVNPAGELVALYLKSDGQPDRLLAMLGKLLLREDRDFHTIQMVEAAAKQYSILKDRPEGAHVLIAAARYLAAHSPTVRAQGQTYQIARRLHRGEVLHED